MHDGCKDDIANMKFRVSSFPFLDWSFTFRADALSQLSYLYPPSYFVYISVLTDSSAVF